MEEESCEALSKNLKHHVSCAVHHLATKLHVDFKNYKAQNPWEREFTGRPSRQKMAGKLWRRPMQRKNKAVGRKSCVLPQLITVGLYRPYFREDKEKKFCLLSQVIIFYYLHSFSPFLKFSHWRKKWEEIWVQGEVNTQKWQAKELFS